MKKITLTALSVAIALGLAACGKAPETTTTETANLQINTAGGTTLLNYGNFSTSTGAWVLRNTNVVMGTSATSVVLRLQAISPAGGSGNLLDSVEAEYEITPHRMITQRQWLDGRIRAGRPAFPAPPVALVFERAIERAGKACNPGPLWLERDPEQFLAAAAFLTNYVLMLRRAGGGRAPSPAWALLGGRMPGVFGEGVSVWDEGLLHRLPTWLRVRAMTACARLLLRPRAADRLGETYWWTPPGAQRDHFGSAWTAATGTLGRASLEMLWEAATAWSPPLRTEVRKVVAHRLAAIGAFRR